MGLFGIVISAAAQSWGGTRKARRERKGFITCPGGWGWEWEALAIVPPDSPQALDVDRVALNLPVRLLVEAGMIFHQHL
mgnify:CR=1 FL=1